MKLCVPFTILSLALVVAPGTANADIPPPCESDASCGEGRICCLPIGACMDADDDDIDECQIAEGEGEGEGEVAAPAEGEGEGAAPAEGEGEAPAEGEGEVPAEGEGEAPTQSKKSDDGCEVSAGAGSATSAALMPLLLLGLLIARRRSN